jgi:hypothetical protein
MQIRRRPIGLWRTGPPSLLRHSSGLRRAGMRIEVTGGLYDGIPRLWRIISDLNFSRRQSGPERIAPMAAGAGDLQKIRL